MNLDEKTSEVGRFDLDLALQCHLCLKQFLSKSDLKLHLRDHGQQDLFFCPECPPGPAQCLSFDSSTKLWSHMSRTHFKAKKGFSCTLCNNKAFKQAFNYHLHMLIHLEEQPEKCRFCSKAFRTKPSLRKHELIHTGCKPYPCIECNSRFKTKDELKQHSISHTTGKPHHCHFCTMSFKYQASLKRHEKKGRCKIGKHWCPAKKNGDNAVIPSNSPQSQALFCDVFLGWETETSVLNNNSMEPPPLFSF